MPAHLLRQFGAWALILGGLALILVFTQIAEPFRGPQPKVETQLGEMAGEFARSAWRSFRGLPRPETVPTGGGTSLETVLFLAIPALAVLALGLAALSLWRNEARTLASYGAGLAVAAITMHYLWWLALVIIGAMLLVAVIQAAGDMFSL